MIQTLWYRLRACLQFIGQCSEGVPRLQEQLREEQKTRQRLEDELQWEVSVGEALSIIYRPLISADSTIHEMARSVLDEALRLTTSIHGFVSVVDADGENRIHSATKMNGNPTHCAAPDQKLSIRRGLDGNYLGLRGHCLNTGEAVYTNAAQQHPAFSGYPAWHHPVERFLAVPVMLGDRPAGQIVLAGPIRDFTNRDIHVVKRLARFYALALQRKEAQEQMKCALEEKEVLLREIHHRVKNNLQVISSLLSLQAGGMTSEGALEMLKESQNRVRSMAMVHEQLHRSRDLSGIHFPEYVRNLTASLFSSYGVDSSTVSLDLRVEDVNLPIDVAVPCGLIVQELVSNSLKHAFPDGRQGEIAISLGPGAKPQENHEVPSAGSNGERAARAWQLAVADNGVGLPKGLEPETSNSLGLRLVRILAEQLNATIDCVAKRGTEFRVNFDNN